MADYKTDKYEVTKLSKSIIKIQTFEASGLKFNEAKVEIDSEYILKFWLKIQLNEKNYISRKSGYRSEVKICRLLSFEIWLYSCCTGV